MLLQYRTPINISVEAGAFLQSLLWSGEASRYITDYRPEITPLSDGKILYTYYVSTQLEKKKPAPNIANATAGWQVGLSYRLYQLSVEASYGQTLFNPFANNDKEVSYYYQNYDAKVKNRYLRVGLRYFL